MPEKNVVITPEMLHLIEVMSQGAHGAIDRLVIVANRILLSMIVGAFGVGVFFATVTIQLQFMRDEVVMLKDEVKVNTKAISAGILTRAQQWQDRHEEYHRELDP